MFNIQVQSTDVHAYLMQPKINMQEKKNNNMISFQYYSCLRIDVLFIKTLSIN